MVVHPSLIQNLDDHCEIQSSPNLENEIDPQQENVDNQHVYSSLPTTPFYSQTPQISTDKKILDLKILTQKTTPQVPKKETAFSPVFLPNNQLETTTSGEKQMIDQFEKLAQIGGAAIPPVRLRAVTYPVVVGQRPSPESFTQTVSKAYANGKIKQGNHILNQRKRADTYSLNTRVSLQSFFNSSNSSPYDYLHNSSQRAFRSFSGSFDVKRWNEQRRSPKTIDHPPETSTPKQSRMPGKTYLRYPPENNKIKDHDTTTVALTTPLSPQSLQLTSMPPSSPPELKEIKNKQSLLLKKFILTTKQINHSVNTPKIIIPCSQIPTTIKQKQQPPQLHNNDDLKDIENNNNNNQTLIASSSFAAGKALLGKQILLVQPNTAILSNYSPKKQQQQQQQRKRFKGQSGFDEKHPIYDLRKYTLNKSAMESVTQTSELIPPQSSTPLYIGRVPTANKDLALAELMLSPWHIETESGYDDYRNFSHDLETITTTATPVIRPDCNLLGGATFSDSMHELPPIPMYGTTDSIRFEDAFLQEDRSREVEEFDSSENLFHEINVEGLPLPLVYLSEVIQFILPKSFIIGKEYVFCGNVEFDLSLEAITIGSCEFYGISRAPGLFKISRNTMNNSHLQPNLRLCWDGEVRGVYVRIFGQTLLDPCSGYKRERKNRSKTQKALDRSRVEEEDEKEILLNHLTEIFK